MHLSWDTLSAEGEVRQGKTIVDASKEARAEHLIFSVLKDVTKLTDGEFKQVFHFDSKARIADYIRESGVPYTNFLPGFYM